MQGSHKRSASALAIILTMSIALSGCSSNPEKGKVKYLESGKRYMQKSKYQEAAIQFQNALVLDPRYAEASYQLAQAELAQHQWRQAYAALEHTIDLDPTRLDARLDRSRLFLAAREFPRTEEEAAFILQRDPGNVAALQILGASLMARGENQAALQNFSKIAELMPNDATAYINLALVEVSLRHFDQGEQYLRKAISVDQHSVQAYTDLVNFYRVRGDVPRAEQVFQEAINQNPNAITLYIAGADLLYSESKTDDAESVLSKLRQQQQASADVAVAIGDFYFQRKQTGQALQEYQRGMTLAPKNLEIQKRAEDLYLMTNEITKAAELDKELAKQKRRDAIVIVNHCRLLMAQGKLDEAIALLQEETKDASDAPHVHYFLARAYWMKGNIEQAKSQFEEASRMAPDLIDTSNSLAELHLQQGDLSAAQQHAEHSVRLRPTDPSVRLLLGTVFQRQGKLDLAREQFLIVQKLAPDDPAIHVRLAQTYTAEHSWSQAEKELNAALQVNPRDYQALGDLVDLWVASKQQAKAFNRMRQYVRTYPDDAQGHLILGSLHLAEKDYSSARAELDRSIELDAKQAPAHLQLGQVFQAQKQSDAAVSEFEKALALQPRFVPLLAMVGNLYVDKGELDKARGYYEQALAIDPNFAIAASNLAWVYAEQGARLDTALGLAQKAKQLMPQLPSVTDTLGWVMYKKGIYVSALPLLQECVEKDPKSALYRYHLGMTLLGLGEKTKAKTQLQAALNLDLSGQDAKAAGQALGTIN